MTTLWRDLASLGLLGADRAVPGQALARKLAGLNLDMDTDLGEILLNAAAVVRLPVRVRTGILPFEGRLPEPVRTDAGERPCTPKSARHLSDIISGKYPLALEEFITVLASRKMILPDEQLPGLFDQCIRDPELWPRIRQVVGSKGRWLSARNPEWAALTDEPDPQRWPDAGKKERIAILLNTRQVDPAGALALMQSTWSADPPADRAAYLGALAESAGPDDEPFLAECAQDRRKEVRQAATAVLSLIPGSRVSTQLFDWASGCITLNKSRIEIRLPAEIPADSADFGILPTPGPKGEGLKVSWLRQLLANIPPGKWETYFQLNARQILSGFVQAKNSDAFLSGFATAAVRFRHSTWAESFIDIRSEDIWSGESGKKLAKLLTAEAFNRKTMELLRQDQLLAEGHPLTWVLCLAEHTWDKNLTLRLIRQFQEHLATTKVYNWSSWHYRRILEVAGYRSDPVLMEELRKNWPVQSPLWQRWEAEVERMMQTMHFRNRMISAANEVK